jgi:3-oxoacyl-[acyl-carrier protein] reductase
MKVAVVTGGSRGIGLAIARALLSRGLAVIISGTNERTLAAAAESLTASGRNGGTVHHVTADVRDKDAVARLMEEAASRFGGLDVLVNNAGVGVYRSVEEMAIDDWRLMFDTNLTGVFQCCQAALPHLRRRGGGWIINIGSLSATGPFAGGSGYCATKAGLIAFTDVLMQEVRHDGIRVSCVMPGSVNTGFGGHALQQSDWKLSPDDVALAVADLLEFPARSLPSRIELRPSQPPKKG